MAEILKAEELIQLDKLNKDLQETIKLLIQAGTETKDFADSLRNAKPTLETLSTAKERLGKTAKTVSDAEKEAIRIRKEGEAAMKAMEKAATQAAREQEKANKELYKSITDKEKAEKALNKEKERAEKINNNLILQQRNMAKELIRMADAGLEGTEAYRKLAKQAGKLKDTINDARAQIKYFASDTRHVDTFVGGMQAAVDVTQLAQGGMALFGSENKEVTEVIKRLVAIQSIANGLQGVQNALQKESALRMGLSAAATGLASAAQSIYTAAVGTSTGALKLFRIALLGTGIGAIIVGIGLLIENWDKLTGSVKMSTQSLEDFKKTSEVINELNESNMKILEAKGASELKLLEQQKKNNDERLDLIEAEKTEIQNKLWLEAKSASDIAKLSERRNELDKEEMAIKTDNRLLSIKYKKAEEEEDKRLFDEKKKNIEKQKEEEGKLQQAKLDWKAEIAKEQEKDLKAIDDELIKKGEASQASMELMITEKEEEDKQNQIVLDNKIQAVQTEKDAKREAHEKELQEIAERNALIEQSAQLVASNVMAAANLSAAINDSKLQDIEENKTAAITALDAQYAKDIAAAGDNEKEKAKLKEKYDKDKLKTEEKYNKQVSAIKRKQAIFDKAAGITSAIINTALSIAKVSWNPVLTALTASLGAIQIATIAAQPIPEFAQGVKDFEGGLADVGDGGEPELIRTKNNKMFLSPAYRTRMYLPKGTDVYSGEKTKEMLSSLDLSQLLNEQKKTTKAVSEINIKTNEINVTENGIIRINRNGNSKTTFINKYN